MHKTKEFAQMAGTTVRTLHHYDRLGLLKPRVRTSAGYRWYEDRDLERLEQIVALKFLGLPLKQIRSLSNGGAVRLTDALAMQRRLLETKRLTLGRAIQAIAGAESHIASGGAATAALRKIIEVIEMENKTTGWKVSDRRITRENRSAKEPVVAGTAGASQPGVE
jgi:DNA-binding transcriptional MerR regulator